MAETNRAAWIRITRSAGARSATPATIMEGVTQPTIIATTCCSARGRAWPNSGTPSISKIEALGFDISKSSWIVCN